jgi:UDP-3-O-[3-hydroxymyristoyl] glucosamine N-acyltransferase
MMIDTTLIARVTGLPDLPPVTCDALGLASEQAGTRQLSFLDDPRHADTLLANPAIVAVFARVADQDRLAAHGKVALPCDDPRFHYFTLKNHLARTAPPPPPSEIDPTACVHPRAVIAERGVRVGAGSVVEPNATILAGTTIGRNCVIRANAVLGSEGFEHKRTSRGILSVAHDGGVVLGDRVEIGAGSCVDRGFAGRPTTIGDDTKVDNLVHIAHQVVIGRRCLVVAHAMLGGSTVIGDDVWIGPNASVSNGLAVGDGAFITMGAVVTRAVPAGARVTGHFAVPHDQFLRHLKWIAQEGYQRG